MSIDIDLNFHSCNFSETRSSVKPPREGADTVAPSLGRGSPLSEQPLLVTRQRRFTKVNALTYVFLSGWLFLTVLVFLVAWARAVVLDDCLPAVFCISVPGLIGLAIRLARWSCLPKMKTPSVVAAPPGMRVGVATTYVAGLEPLAMLEKTVRAMVELRYPHDTWVLDESNDPGARDLCLRLGARHFSRQGLSHYQAEDGPFQASCKHGNYNAWLDAHGFGRYDILVAFDPDHVPSPDFLDHVLGFFRDPSIAFVQTPQAYSNADVNLVARGTAEESFEFYSFDQPVGDSAGQPLLIGCHNAHRVAALRQVGGFAPHFADDILLTLLYRKRGWKGVYLPRILARGCSPEDWPTYITQQRRWARSLLDLKLRVYPKLVQGLPLSSRLLAHLHGLVFLKDGILVLLFIAGIIACLAGGVGLVAFAARISIPAALLIGSLVASSMFKARFKIDRSDQPFVYWRGLVVRFAKWPFFLMAVGEVLKGERFGYDATPKLGRRVDDSLILLPHALTILAVAGSLAVGVARGLAPDPLALASACLITIASGGLIAHEWYERRRSLALDGNSSLTGSHSSRAIGSSQTIQPGPADFVEAEYKINPANA